MLQKNKTPRKFREMKKVTECGDGGPQNYDYILYRAPGYPLSHSCGIEDVRRSLVDISIKSKRCSFHHIEH